MKSVLLGNLRDISSQLSEPGIELIVSHLNKKWYELNRKNDTKEIKKKI